jgi:membrane protein implicated in regulation of membrane protease activity
MFYLFLIDVSYIWFLVGFLCIVIELTVPGLFYFLSGSIAALIVGLSVIFFNPNITIQMILFCVISIINFLLLKKYTEKSLHAQKDHYTPHMSKLVGKEAIVVIEIKKGISGQVRINNEIWMAYAFDNQEYEIGAKVRINAISGVHVIVQPFGKDKNDH